MSFEALPLPPEELFEPEPDALLLLPDELFEPDALPDALPVEAVLFDDDFDDPVAVFVLPDELLVPDDELLLLPDVLPELLPELLACLVII